MFRQGRAQFTAAPIAGANDVLERHRLAGQFGIDRSAQEALAKVDPHCGQIARVVADGDVLANVRRES